MTTQYALTVDNKKVWTFFKEKHPSLDIENSILMFIDIMEKLSQDVNTSLNNVLAQQLVDSMKQLQSQVNVVTDNLSTMQRDTINNFTLKLAEFKKDYIEDVKMILTSNVSDKIAPLIREQNAMILDKTHILINDLIPPFDGAFYSILLTPIWAPPNFLSCVSRIQLKINCFNRRRI